MFKLKSQFALAIFIVLLFNAEASAQQFSSGENPVALLELYTSEGCSSCPPADRWMSSLKDHDDLWTGFVPLAFHVDYWNYIGWTDRFASPEYSQRQRRYASEYGESTVYTPGVRKAGEELRGWYRTPSLSDKASSPVGELVLEVDQGGAFNASFNNKSEDDARVLNIAILGLDLATEVERGENHGKRLEHDFVVLGISRYSSAELGRWSGQLPSHTIAAPEYAVAAWVSNGRNISPIQATGGYLADNVVLVE